LGFAAAISILSGVLFGLAPAFRIAQADLASAMKQSAGAVSEAGRQRRLGKVLVVAQVAVSSALIVAAGLFVRSLRAMEGRDLGFARQGLYVFGLDPTREGYAGSRLANLYEKIREEILAAPSVQNVTLYDNLPFNGSSNTNFSLVGSNRKVPDSVVRWATVGPDFCRTMGIRLLAGRDFRDTDTAASAPVGLVNEIFVQHFCGDANPIGQRFTGVNGREAFEIVGVVKEVELVDLHSGPKAKAFVPYAQIPGRLSTMFFEVRAAGQPGGVVAGLRAAVRRVDPNLPLLNLSTQIEIVNGAMLLEEVFARLASLFGMAALLLSCIGLYGTMAYTVAQRTKEIGIRVSLGATPRMILGMVLSQGLVLIAAGAGTGLLASLGLARFLRGVLYGVAENDPATFILAGALIAVVALLACYGPARRATKVDPVVALRSE
jgi:predicted permease